MFSYFLKYLKSVSKYIDALCRCNCNMYIQRHNCNMYITKKLLVFLILKKNQILYLNSDTSIVFRTKNHIFLHKLNIKNKMFKLVNHFIKRETFTRIRWAIMPAWPNDITQLILIVIPVVPKIIFFFFD